MNLQDIILKFRISDLKKLLKFFKYPTNGTKSNLRNWALYLLQHKPRNLDYDAYLNKIVNIYASMPRTRFPRTHYNQYQQSKYFLRSTCTPRAASPQAQRGTYTYNQGNYVHRSINTQNINQLAGLRNTFPRILSSQQTNTVVNDMNYFIPSAQSLANVNFKKNPFMEIIAETIKINALVGHNRCTLRKYSKDMREAEFKFSLSLEQVALLAKNQDMSNEKNGNVYQLQIRISFFEPGCTEMVDYLPLGLHIRLNNNVCPLPEMAQTTQIEPESEARRIPRPINCCTEHAKLEPSKENTITLNWIPDFKKYVMGMYLVKNLTSEVLIQKLQDKVPRSTEEIKSMIGKKSVNADPDVTNTSYFCSLICPIGQIRIKIPAKSTNCNHLQCFDARTYILMNEKTPTWMCPICNKPGLYDDILIESYFLEVISNPKLPDNCKEIEILADGSWKVRKENKEIVEIAADIEEKHNHNPKSKKKSENMKSIVDLTSSEDVEVFFGRTCRSTKKCLQATVTTSSYQFRERSGNLNKQQPIIS